MKTKLLIIFLLVLSIIPLLDLLHPGLPVTHDGQDHVARIANFYANLQEGVIVPRWAENLNWGYGHPILMFLYPMSSYTASLIHFFGFSFVDSAKIVFSIAFILSGIFMYLWLSCFLTMEASFVGSMLYVFAPYRFVDLYVRGAIGEHMAFVFPPLVCFFLYKVSVKRSYSSFVGGAISIALLILSHNALSIMFLAFIVFYIIYLAWNSKKPKNILMISILVLLLGFCLSAFFWMPALIEGKYTLRDIVTKGGYLTNFVSFQQLLYGPWSYGGSGEFTAQVGILQWLSFIFAFPLLIYFVKMKNRSWLLILGSLFYFFITIYLMIPLSMPIWGKISLMQKFQFPWRFLSLSVFLTAILGAYVFSLIPLKKQIIPAAIISILLLFLNKDYWHAHAYMQKPESFYSGIYNGTTDTGESAPIWSIRFMEKQPKAHLEVIQGKAKIKVGERKTTKHDYIVTSDSKSKLRENTLYFPGWIIAVDGKFVNLQFQDPNNRGLMTFFVEKGTHTIIATFTETKMRIIADVLSGVSLFAILILSILKKRLWER